ncbi:hypothetical protein SAMN05216215_103365 [Saccharopolyspora shandongensis]|uniref:Uncharacterized protein n=1 Tax=Saccharopolyspora shandongensis TaxID=418495 RepID=A0A1H3M6L6_9PSEU|nr:hypothetical protein SAMN05216215_103365 [Saccharopolyspora shandongensis]
MVEETDLFGNPIAPLKPREAPRPPVNDMELVERILREASSVGFVVVGVREDVYRRVTDDLVEKASSDVDAAVHQLIDAKWLEVGGTHTVRYDRYSGPARSVLVPRKSKQTAYRWQSLSKPEAWGSRGRGKSAA